jgi:hypothetical protein
VALLYSPKPSSSSGMTSKGSNDDPLVAGASSGDDVSDSLFFDKVIRDEETGLLSVAYKEIGILTVMVPVAEFNNVIAINAHRAEWRKDVVSACEKKRKSLALRQWIEKAIPTHFALSFDQNFCFDFQVSKKTRGRPKKHPYSIGGSGYCAARKDGCETQFIAGFTEASLRKLMVINNENDSIAKDDDTIELSVAVTGSCVHIKDKRYGTTKRYSHVASRAAKIEKKTDPDPVEFAEDMLVDDEVNDADDDDASLRSSNGLTSCKFANVFLSSEITNNSDIESRLKRKDKSTNLLGIARTISLSPNVMWQLWTKGNVQLYHRLAKRGKLVINVDATDSVASIPLVEGVTDNMVHTKVSVKDTTMRMLSPLTVAEMISNGNTGVDITAFFQAFIKDAKDCHPEEFPPKPLMCITDCSPQLESAALAAFGSEGMITSHILYGNVVLMHLLHFDKEIANDPSTRVVAAKAIFSKLKLRIGIFLKERASHVYRAPHTWMHRNKSTEFSRWQKARFESLLKASFASILRDDRISEAIVRWSVILAVLETPRFKTPSFGDTSSTHNIKNKDDRTLELSHAAAIDAFIRSESKQLHVNSLEDIATTLLEVREDQHLLLHEPIVAKAKSLLKHSCVYLSGLCLDDATNETMGTLCCSFVYGREIVGGAVTAMTEDGYNVGVKLPHNGDRGINNPLYSPTVANYLRDTWMKTISLWSRGVVDLVECAMDMEIEGKHNQESLEVVKHGPDVDEHFSDPSEYVLHRWKECQESETTLIKNYGQMQKRRSPKKRKHVEMSQDVLTLETNLRNGLLAIFTELGLRNNVQAHSRISECLSDADNIAVMSYPTFNNFMNQLGQSRNGLKSQLRKGLQAFVSRHAAMLSAELATAALRDLEDDESQCEDPEPILSQAQVLALETSLRNELLSIFAELGLTNNMAAHIHISECFSDTDNIAVMSYPTYNNFMNHRAPARNGNGLKPHFRKGLQAYVSKQTALLTALATAAVRDSEDESQCDDP